MARGGHGGSGRAGAYSHGGGHGHGAGHGYRGGYSHGYRGGYGYGHGYRVGFGISFALPYYWPSYYPGNYASYYSYPYTYPGTAYAYPGPAAGAYVERDYAQAAPAPRQDWYYCAGSNAYYPYVRECPGGWQRVPSEPPPR
ncbi:MAG: hypothetical protein IH606_15055 [Burkholderiales bacterium]|nr:hypothetical protein [Burkholderiales bacterium]